MMDLIVSGTLQHGCLEPFKGLETTAFIPKTTQNIILLAWKS